MKRFLVFLLFIAANIGYANTIAIDSECVTLRDIFPSMTINDNIACGIDYGQEKVINRQMASFIINKYGIKGAVPGEVTFRRNGTIVSEDRLRQDIKNRLSVMYPELDIEINAVRMSRDFYTADGKNYNIEIPANRFGNISVTLDNGFKKTSYSISITAFKEIYVSSAQIKKGEDISDKVTLFRTDLSKVHGDPIKSPDGFIAKMNISSGRPVTSNVVDKRPDALKDSAVTIVIKSGNLEVFASGTLMEDAYEGKIVRAENTASGKIIRGEYREGRKVIVNAR